MAASAMGLVMGSSYPFQYPQFSTSSSLCSSSSSTSQSICFFYCTKTPHNRRKHMKVTARMNQEAQDGSVRRTILFVGISVLPLLKLRAADALESVTAGQASKNSFLSLLNGLGIFGSGVLGALYALSRKEKATSEATIESLRNKLLEKETAIIAMDKKYESELINEKQIRNDQLRKAREEQQSLTSQLSSANDTVVRLGQELQKEKKLVEELKASIEGLQIDLMKAGEEKRELQDKLKEKNEAIGDLQERINMLSLEIKDKDDKLHHLGSELAEKEIELHKVSSTLQQLQEKIASLNSENEELKDKLRINGKEVELKDAKVADLNAQIGSLLVERDESNKKFDSIKEEYSDFKSSSLKKAAEDAKLLEDREHAIHQFKEQLESALSEVSKNKVLVADLTAERDDLRKMLDVEMQIVKKLEEKLHIAQETLEKSRNEATDLTNQLLQSKELCMELEAELSKVKSEFAEARESLQRKAEEAKRGAEVLAGELTSVKEQLKKKNDEAQTLANELSTVVQTRDDLQNELVDVYKKAESAVRDLQEEKILNASLNQELKSLETQTSKEREARKHVENDLEEATRSISEINRNALELTKELNLASAQISSLQEEKDALYKSLAEQKNVSLEARENLEDAHSLVLRLGEERQNLEKRGKKLEEELASAKGEILRLRSQINSSKTVVNDQHQQTVDAAAAAPPVKKVTRRRRKTVKQQDTSS
ncbi:hypothetical protein M9H77_29367 [Catharanthus roseus]|uniref:Uncharacterized protein n=1 Tax=Catharanthus roseus TaxID=4058 RepID=A0ACC0AIX4_CATRO|nr:hypothetical protein M9H77_29367 [Catharanthus roseus]